MCHKNRYNYNMELIKFIIDNIYIAHCEKGHNYCDFFKKKCFGLLFCGTFALIIGQVE